MFRLQFPLQSLVSQTDMGSCLFHVQSLVNQLMVKKECRERDDQDKETFCFGRSIEETIEFQGQKLKKQTHNPLLSSASYDSGHLVFGSLVSELRVKTDVSFCLRNDYLVSLFVIVSLSSLHCNVMYM